MYRLLVIQIVLGAATLGSCWQFYTSINDFSLEHEHVEHPELHSEYKFGNCDRRGIVLYTHTHLDHTQVTGKIIVRGWLNIKRIPTCIVMKAKSAAEDLMQSTSYNFQICVPRITYCHSHKRYKYFYYEWYIPYEYTGGMNWDLYFYGSPNLEWQ